MISIIFRIFAWSALIASGVLYFINQEDFVSFNSKIKNAENLKKEAKLNLETDQNKSSDLINGMFRARGKLRLEIEETQANADKLKEEAEIILLKESDLSARNTKLIKELESVRKELAEQTEKTAQKRKQGDPIRLEVEQARTQFKEIEEQNKKVKSIRDQLDSELSALRTRREVAQRSYQEEKERLLSEIERPPHHYYGDELGIDILSVSPSGAGIFTVDGIKSGFRDGFTYLAYEQNEPDQHFYLKASLVQKELTFLEFDHDYREKAISSIRPDQKLFLIRTGDSNTTIH
jgi:flagellar biosynthesis GTPase FlhF